VGWCGGDAGPSPGYPVESGTRFTHKLDPSLVGGTRRAGLAEPTNTCDPRVTATIPHDSIADELGKK